MTVTPRARPALQLSFTTREAFLACYFHQGPVGGLFIPGVLNLGPGTEVTMNLVFKSDDRTLQTRGIVRWTRTRPAKNLPAGTGIELLASERRTRDLLLDFAHGRLVTWVRARAQRWPIAMTVRYQTESVLLTDLTDDISVGGLFIHTDEPLAVGTKLRLKLKAPGQWFSLTIQGEVAWRQAEGRRGIGVHFLPANPREQQRIDRLIARLHSHVAATLNINVG